MKKNSTNLLDKFLHGGLVVVASLAFAIVVHAQTWNAPTGTPPTGNTPTPINTGSSSQFKLGTLGVGESSSALLTATSFQLEVNGPVSSNGFASFGTTFLTQATHIGPTSTSTTLYAGANMPSFGTSKQPLIAGESLTYATEKSFAMNDSKNTSDNSQQKNFFNGNGFFDKVGGFISNLFEPSLAYAIYDTGSILPIVDPVNPTVYGPCFGNWCNSSQYCDMTMQACNTAGLTSGNVDANTSIPVSGFVAGTYSSTNPGTAIGLPTAVGGATILPGTPIGVLFAELSLSPIPSSGTFVPTTATTTLTGSETLNWAVGSASNCSLTSSNIGMNVSIPSITLSPAGFSLGTYSMSFSGASPGSYTYTLSCQPKSSFFNAQAVSSSVTVTVGDKYVFQVSGNSSLQGYVVADGNIVTNGGFIERGKRVCLQDGTDCPLNSATSIINPIDQGGSIELGNNDTANSNRQTPYIDFHYGSATNSVDDYNMRIINDATSTLSFYNQAGAKVLYLNSTGLHLGTGMHMYTSTGTQMF